MHELCINKVGCISSHIEKHGKLYDDFESAMPYYKNHGKIDGNSNDIEDFNSLMEFFYLGRKPK